MNDLARKRIAKRQWCERNNSDNYVIRVTKSVERAERRRANREAVDEWRAMIGRAEHPCETWPTYSEDW